MEGAEFPRSPVAKTPISQRRGPWVSSLVGEVDPHAATQSSRVATKDPTCQINKYINKGDKHFMWFHFMEYWTAA